MNCQANTIVLIFDPAITGLGTNDPLDCNLLKIGHFSKAKCSELKKKGAVGDL